MEKKIKFVSKVGARMTSHRSPAFDWSATLKSHFTRNICDKMTFKRHVPITQRRRNAIPAPNFETSRTISVRR